MIRFPWLFLTLVLCLPALASDLTVGWISRSPDIDYVWNSSNPKVEGWPKAGETVIWRAHVRSWFDAPKTIAYAWRLNGVEIARGTATVPANGSATIDLPRPWTFTRQRISIAIDTGSAVAEESEVNNALEVFSDALAVGFWVEQGFYDYFREHQHELGIGSTSFENWAQRMIDFHNDMAAMAVYPETPRGVLDRWRIQKIVVVPNGALPLVPPHHEQRGNEPNTASTQPYSTDRTIDLQWGFQASKVGAYGSRSVSIENPFYINPAIIHEIGHARYLTDVYAFDVRSRAPANVVAIRELIGPSLLYSTPEQGLMNRNHTFIDRYSAVALNLIAGHRAILGSYNDPENVGSFLNDLPAENRLTIRDASGNLMAEADVQIFQSVPYQFDAWYATNYDDTPDLTLRTDANGQVLVGRNPFATDGPIVNDWRASNVVALVRVERSGVAKWGFLESRLFNLAFWRGDTALADHELVVGRSKPCGATGPVLTSPAWDTATRTPTLTWLPLTGAVRYNVYAASPSHPTPRLLGTTTATELPATLSGRTYWWVAAVFADSCPPLRSDAWRVDAPAMTKRRAVR